VHALKELLLREPRWTLAVAESLTGGNVQARVAAISGASSFFLGGITAYTLDQKVKHLGVDRSEAEAANAVSATVAEQMARGACSLFGSDIGIATTGYAEPDASRGVPVPFAWWAIAFRSGVKGGFLRHGRIECPGMLRIEAQAIISDTLIAALVATLAELRG
jgi:nicotinamide-nucleotide amidase